MSYELLFGSTTEMATPNELDDQPSYENRASADETKEPYAGTAESTPTPSRAGTFSMSSSNFIDSITQSVTQSVNSLSQTLIPLLSSSSPSSSTTPIPTTTTIQVSSAVNPILNSSASDSSATSSVAGATTQTLIESPEHPFANPFFNTTSPSLIHIPAFSATDRNHDEGNPRASLDSMRSARSAELPHEDELDHDAYDEDEGDTVDGSVRARIGSNGSLEFQDAQGPPDDRIVVERIGKDKPSVNRRASWGTTGERDGRSIMVIEELSVEAQSCADQDFQPTPFTENSDPFAANGGTPNLEPHGRDGCMNERSQLLNRNQRRFQRCFPEIANEATVLGGWYNCAMERDILWQGQVFCTSHYVCFYGKLFAKAVRVMIHFQDIVRIEKMNSLMVIPNALKVVTASKQYVFTSFLGRDTAFAELHGAWWRFRHKGFGNTSTHSLFDGGFRTAISDANAPSNTPATLDTNARQSHRRQRSNSDAAVYMTALSDVTPYADYSTPVTSDPPKSSNTSRLLRAAKESAISIPSFPKRKFNRPRADSEATTNSEGAASGSEDHPQPQASTSTPIKAPKPGARRKHQSLIGIPSSVTALVTQFSAGSGGEEDDKVCKSPDTYNEKDGKGFASLNGKSRAKGSAKANAKSKKDSITQPSSLLDGHGGLDMGSLATAAVAAPPVVTVTQAQAQVSISAQSSNTPAQSPSQDKRAQFGDFMRKAKLSGLGGSGGRPALGFAAAAIAGANSVMTQQQNVFRRQRATQAGRASSESMRAEEVEVQKESKAEDAIDGIDDGEMQDALDLDLSESETETETDITTDDETSLVTRLNVVSATPPPADPVPCACPSHLKHLLGEWVFPIPVAALHALMWGDDMTLVWEPCHIRRESKDLKFGEWKVDAQGRPLRKFDYHICMRILFQKSFALCLEEQTIEKDTDFVKVVRTISRQPEVPMGSTFEVSTQTCLTHEGPGRSRMKVTMMLDWKAYNFMAGKIERTAVENSTDYFKVMAATISEFIENNGDHPYLSATTVHASAVVDTNAEPKDAEPKDDKPKTRRRKKMAGEVAADGSANLHQLKKHLGHTTALQETVQVPHHKAPEAGHSKESGPVRVFTPPGWVQVSSVVSRSTSLADKRKGLAKHTEVTSTSLAGEDTAVAATIVPVPVPSFTNIFASPYPIFKLFCGLFIGLVNLLRSARDRNAAAAAAAAAKDRRRLSGGYIVTGADGSTRAAEADDARSQRKLVTILLVMVVVMMSANLWNMWTVEERIAQSVMRKTNAFNHGHERLFEDISAFNGEDFAAYISQLEEAANRHHHARLDALTRHIHDRLLPLRMQAAQLQQEVTDVLRILDEVLIVQGEGIEGRSEKRSEKINQEVIGRGESKEVPEST